MGLLNRLFGKSKGIAKELYMDESRRLALWKQNVANYEIRERLSRHFNYKNIDSAIKNFEETVRVLEQIESSISSELVTLDEEFKVDEEILNDLEDLELLCDVDGIRETFGALKKKEKILMELFHKIFKCLMVELHLIRMIKQKPDNVKELLLQLFDIIFKLEDKLYKLFRDKYYTDESERMNSDITRITRAILLQEKIEEQKETGDEKFARELGREMAQPESAHRYRKLGESILDKLAKMAGSPFSKEGEEYMASLGKMEGLIDDDNVMYGLVKKLRPKYDDTKIKIVINVFRSAYSDLHFEDLTSGI